MIRKESTDPVSDRVSIRLSEYERNINQKYFLKNTNFRWTFHSSIVRSLLSRISLVKFLKIIAFKTEQVPQKNHSVSNFRESSS